MSYLLSWVVYESLLQVTKTFNKGELQDMLKFASNQNALLCEKLYRLKELCFFQPQNGKC